MTKPDPATDTSLDRVITVAVALIAAFQFMVGTVCIAAFYSVTITAIQQAVLGLCGLISFLLGFGLLYASLVFAFEDKEG